MCFHDIRRLRKGFAPPIVIGTQRLLGIFEDLAHDRYHTISLFPKVLNFRVQESPCDALRSAVAFLRESEIFR